MVKSILLFLIVLLTGGCQCDPTPRPVGESAPTEQRSLKPEPPFCEYVVRAPLEASGLMEPAHYFNDQGDSCDPPEWSARLMEVSMGFHGPDLQMFKVGIARDTMVLNEDRPLGSNDFIYWEKYGEQCSEWTDVHVVVRADVPDWSISVRATCVTDPTVRIDAEVKGSFPSEWR